MPNEFPNMELPEPGDEEHGIRPTNRPARPSPSSQSPSAPTGPDLKPIEFSFSNTPPTPGTPATSGTPKTPNTPPALSSSAIPVMGGWRVGDRVLAPWDGYFAYVGTVAEVAPPDALIHFDDDDEGWVYLADLKPVAFWAGQEIHCRRTKGGAFHPGTVQDVMPHAVEVELTNGDVRFIDVGDVRIFLDPSCAPARPTRRASHLAFAENLQAGDRVWAPWINSVAYVGIVRELTDTRALIAYADGDEGWVRLHMLLPFEPVPGLRVFANWKMQGNYFPGIIREVDGNRYYIHYDDGDKEWVKMAALTIPATVAEGDVKPTKQQKPSPFRSWNWMWIVIVSLIVLRGCAAAMR